MNKKMKILVIIMIVSVALFLLSLMSFYFIINPKMIGPVQTVEDAALAVTHSFM